MIFAWIGIIFFALAGIGGAVLCIVGAETNVGKIGGSVGSVVVCFAIAGLIFWWLYSTESGSRAKKTFESETKGGLYRVVKVYDMEGEQIAEYSGKFDVQEHNDSGITKIKFDCDGKRHVIYCSTGTVIIDETGAKESEGE